MNFLTPLKRRKVKREKFAVFDIEANNWTDFEMLGFYDGMEFCIFHDIDSFLNAFLRKSYRGYTVYAHNGGQYDFRFIIDTLLKKKNRYKIKFLEGFGRIREIKITDKSKHTWTFADSFSILPESLKKLTHDFDVLHKKKEIDYSSISKDSPSDRDYLKHDCLGLYEVLEKYHDQEIFKGLKVRGTTASNAMILFRATMKEDIKCLNLTQENFVRASYFGGRVECFRMLGERIKHYDFNSLYPFVMSSYEMPVGFPVWVREFYEDWPGFYYAEVDYPPETYLPALPLLFENKLLFPCGKFTGFFTSCEMSEALKQGARFKIKKGLIFKVTKNLFTDFIAQFYKMKADAPKGSVQYLIAKLTLNSCYGKFGQRRDRDALIHCDLEEATKRGLTEYLPEFDLYTEKSFCRGGYILPHIASWITALARRELFRALIRDGDPYYCDTDSLFTRKAYPTGAALGDLKLEGEYAKAVFLRPKTYAVKDASEHLKAKGFCRDMVRNLSYKDYENSLLTGNYLPFKQEAEKFVGIKASLKRFGKATIRCVEKKSIRSEYTKRRVLKDYSTLPIVLNGN